jgi:uncharacterized cupin superfamily protein
MSGTIMRIDVLAARRAAAHAPRVADWFVVNVADADWFARDGFGAGCPFEGRERPFAQVGINIRVLGPGDAIALYHRESAQEDFLVLSGTCTLVIEGEERQLRAWDFVHCPPETAHALLGGPCILLAIGARAEGVKLLYPVDETAIRLGAGVREETDSPDEAYKDAPPVVPGKPESWNDLPWVTDFRP